VIRLAGTADIPRIEALMKSVVPEPETVQCYEQVLRGDARRAPSEHTPPRDRGDASLVYDLGPQFDVLEKRTVAAQIQRRPENNAPRNS
jgi:hypothetical protein